jgi:type IV secretion system protein VirB9
MRPLGAVAVLAATLPIAAGAQTVPAIQANAGAHSSVTVGQQASTPTLVTSSGGGNAAQVKPPPGWPPTLQTMAPSAPLDAKERRAVAMATAWRNQPDRPHRDPQGVLRWVFGLSQPRIVCAPFQMCDLELQPGEVINNVRLGDTGFWTVTPAISGSPRTTHLAISPRESGRSTSMIVYTDRRTYNVKLVSSQRDYTPLTGFIFPDDEQANSFAAYRDAVAGGAMAGAGPVSLAGGGIDPRRIQFLKITGDSPSWRPTEAYTDGRKTYIKFPSEMQFGDSPTIVGLNNDGGLFSAPTERRVIYRHQGDLVVVDSVLDRLKLVLGVGSGQQEVTLERPH